MDKKQTRSDPKQINEAKKLLSEGKGPLSVVSITGVSLSTAYTLQKKLRNTEEKNQVNLANPESVTKPARVTIAEEPPVPTSLMLQKDVETVGIPDSISLKNVPKNFRLEIGPVAKDLIGAVVEEAIKPFDAIGITNVHLVITVDGGVK